MKIEKKKRICRISNIPFFFCHHIRSQIEASVKAGFEVHLICSDGPGADKLKTMSGVIFHPVEITRKISLWKDLLSLWKLYTYFRVMHFDIVHTATSKAGILGAIAGKIAKVPIRLHNFSGQPWISLAGNMRHIMIALDRWIVKLNTRCYSDSRSQINLLSSYNICNPSQVHVLGEGSIAGIDLQRFDPEIWSKRREQICISLKLPTGRKVITFIGRITIEKGILELIEAFDSLTKEGSDTYLIIVGPIEKERFPIPPRVLEIMKSHPRIRFVGYSNEPERYLSISDILCLPSYRESFGISVIEAASMGVPTVASKVTGLVDSVINGETGILVPPKDSISLKQALLNLLNDNEMRKLMGRKAQARARHFFDQNIINSYVIQEYENLLKLVVSQC